LADSSSSDDQVVICELTRGTLSGAWRPFSSEGDARLVYALPSLNGFLTSPFLFNYQPLISHQRGPDSFVTYAGVVSVKLPTPSNPNLISYPLMVRVHELCLRPLDTRLQNADGTGKAALIREDELKRQREKQLQQLRQLDHQRRVSMFLDDEEDIEDAEQPGANYKHQRERLLCKFCNHLVSSAETRFVISVR
jgi:hypothetical protein